LGSFETPLDNFLIAWIVNFDIGGKAILND
jgi:hypothetical protein